MAKKAKKKTAKKLESPIVEKLKTAGKKKRKRNKKDLTSREGHIQKLIDIVEDPTTEDRNQLDAMRQLAKISGLSDRKLDLSSMSLDERVDLVMDTVAPVLSLLGFKVIDDRDEEAA